MFFFVCFVLDCFSSWFTPKDGIKPGSALRNYSRGCSGNIMGYLESQLGQLHVKPVSSYYIVSLAMRDNFSWSSSVFLFLLQGLMSQSLIPWFYSIYLMICHFTYKYLLFVKLIFVNGIIEIHCLILSSEFNSAIYV